MQAGEAQLVEWLPFILGMGPNWVEFVVGPIQLLVV